MASTSVKLVSALDIAELKLNVEAFNSYRKTFDEPARKVVSRGERCKKAAILLPFAVIDDELKLLVTMRHPSISSYPNEISFPGGTVDEGDQNSVDTALREAHEEIGLRPQDVTIIGSVDDIASTYRKKTGQSENATTYVVSVVVGLLHNGISLKKNCDEVDEIIYGSIDCMFSSLKVFQNGNIEVAVMKLNKSSPVFMYGFSAYVAIYACIILDLVPNHCLYNVKNIMIDLGRTGSRYFPQYFLEFCRKILDTDRATINSKTHVVSKI